MGRWAQRQRRGGGPGTRPPPTITITSVVIDSNPGGVLEIAFSDDVDFAQFSPADFFNADVGFPADTLNPDSSNSLFASAVAWQGLLNAGEAIVYSGSAAGVVTPQTVPII